MSPSQVQVNATVTIEKGSRRFHSIESALKESRSKRSGQLVMRDTLYDMVVTEELFNFTLRKCNEAFSKWKKNKRGNKKFAVVSFDESKEGVKKRLRTMPQSGQNTPRPDKIEQHFEVAWTVLQSIEA